MPRRAKKRLFAEDVNYWRARELDYARRAHAAEHHLSSVASRQRAEDPFSVTPARFRTNAEHRLEKQFIQGDREFAIDSYLRASRYKKAAMRSRKNLFWGTVRRLFAGWKTNVRLANYRRKNLKK